MSSRGGFGEGRGRFGRGRGGSGQQTRWRGTPTSTTTIPQLPPTPFGPVVDTINVNSLLIEESAPTIEDVTFISSYNWFDAKSPVILVPGAPPLWTPLPVDIKLKPDSEPVYRDINAAHYSSYPMEPAVRSVLAMKPSFDIQGLDIVGCGSTIGNLLRCAGSQPRSFRFDLNLVGDTLFMVRREKSPTEIITDLKGFGHTFPEAYTTWEAEVRSSCSHQRVIQYDFGGLRMLVRSEADAYIQETNAPLPPKPLGSTKQPSLEDALDTMSVSNRMSGVPPQQKFGIMMQGTEVAQSQIFDIKTRASYKPFDMGEILPRLWVNQTSKFLIAYHQFGLFDNPQVKDVRQDVLRWQKDNFPLLSRFQALLRRVVDAVRDSDSHHFEVSWDGESQGPLLITKQVGRGRKALPSDLAELWENSS